MDLIRQTAYISIGDYYPPSAEPGEASNITFNIGEVSDWTSRLSITTTSADTYRGFPLRRVRHDSFQA